MAGALISMSPHVILRASHYASAEEVLKTIPGHALATNEAIRVCQLRLWGVGINLCGGQWMCDDEGHRLYC